MEVQSNENAALLKLLKSKSRTKTELLKVSSARRRARQAALDALLAEGKVIRIDKEYFANDPSGSVEELIHAEAVRLDAYLRSVPELLSRSGEKLRRAVKDNALASVALQRLLETGRVIVCMTSCQFFLGGGADTTPRPAGWGREEWGIGNRTSLVSGHFILEGVGTGKSHLPWCRRPPRRFCRP